MCVSVFTDNSCPQHTFVRQREGPANWVTLWLESVSPKEWLLEVPLNSLAWGTVWRQCAWMSLPVRSPTHGAPLTGDLLTVSVHFLSFSETEHFFFWFITTCTFRIFFLTSFPFILFSLPLFLLLSSSPHLFYSLLCSLLPFSLFFSAFLLNHHVNKSSKWSWKDEFQLQKWRHSPSLEKIWENK